MPQKNSTNILCLIGEYLNQIFSKYSSSKPGNNIFVKKVKKIPLASIREENDYYGTKHFL